MPRQKLPSLSIELYRGTDDEYTFQVLRVTSTNQTPEDTTGWTFTFTVKENDFDTVNVLQKTTAGGGITDIDPLLGSHLIKVVPADSVSAKAGPMVYDIEAIEDTGEKRIVAKGVFTMLEPVT